MGPFGVDVALCYCTGTTGFVASLEKNKNKVGGGLSLKKRDLCAVFIDRTKAHVTCDVLHAIWVELLLAFPTVLLEVNLEHRTSMRTGSHNAAHHSLAEPCLGVTG